MILQSPVWLARSSSSATHTHRIPCPAPCSATTAAAECRGAESQRWALFLPRPGRANTRPKRRDGRASHTPRGDCGSHAGPSGISYQSAPPSKSTASSSLPPTLEAPLISALHFLKGVGAAATASAQLRAPPSSVSLSDTQTL